MVEVGVANAMAPTVVFNPVAGLQVMVAPTGADEVTQVGLFVSVPVRAPAVASAVVNPEPSLN